MVLISILVLKEWVHDYYYQVQGQLRITNRKYCYFVVFTKKGLVFEKNNRDDEIWKKEIKPKLKKKLRMPSSRINRPEGAHKSAGQGKIIIINKYNIYINFMHHC